LRFDILSQFHYPIDMEQTHTKTVGIALLADPAFCDYVDRLVANMKSELKSDFSVSPLPKHVSLRQSFPYRGENETLEAYLKTFFKDVPSLSIKTKKIQVFLTEGGRNALVWVRLKYSFRLLLLHFSLVYHLKKRFGVPYVGYDGLRWIFHSTILYEATDPQIALALKQQFDNIPTKTVIRPSAGVTFYCTGNPDHPTEYCVGKTFDISTTRKQSMKSL